MRGNPTTPRLVELQPQHCVVVRETVPMSQLPEYFSRVFHATMREAQTQGCQIVGPPFATYYSMPTDTVDVAAGFPIDQPITPTDNITAIELPGGKAVQKLHIGSYDTVVDSYNEMRAWIRVHQHTGSDIMWESYLNEPKPGHPEEAQTLITWPVE